MRSRQSSPFVHVLLIQLQTDTKTLPSWPVGVVKLWHKQSHLRATAIFVLMHSGCIVNVYQLLCEAHTVLEPHFVIHFISILSTVFCCISNILQYIHMLCNHLDFNNIKFNLIEKVFINLKPVEKKLNSHFYCKMECTLNEIHLMNYNNNMQTAC